MASVDFPSALGTLDDNSEMIREYWRDLRASWQASENSLRRTLFYILALATAFILLNSKALGSVTFLGLKLTNLDLVATLIPAVIAYLIYVASTNAAIAMELGNIHDRLASHYWPNFYQANLELTVRPVGSFSESTLISENIKNGLLENIAVGASVIRFGIYMVAPIVFEVYALWHLIGRHEEILWLEWLVAAFTVLMTLASTPNYLYLIKETFGDF